MTAAASAEELGEQRSSPCAQHYVTENDDVWLLGTRCGICAAVAFPARAGCPACGASRTTSARLAPTGTVHSWTRVERPPAGFAGPVVAALVDLDAGPRLFCLIDREPATTGRRVRARLAEVRGRRPGFVFVLAEDRCAAANDDAGGDRGPDL